MSEPERGSRSALACNATRSKNHIVGDWPLVGSSAYAFALFYRTIQQEQARIHLWHQQIRTALSAGDTNAVLALVAPQMRSSLMTWSTPDWTVLPSHLVTFVHPHLGREATVWPVRTSH